MSDTVIQWPAQEQEQGGRDSRLRGLSGEALLSQMPLLQHLLSRLIDCRPTGGAVHDPVVHVRDLLCSVCRV